MERNLCTSSLKMPFKFFILPEIKQLTQAVKGIWGTKWELYSRESGGGYVDANSVPWRVPDEFKARNQTEAGFESVFSQRVTVNKNVD